MKKEDIQSKIDVMLENLERLHTLRSLTFENFVADFRNIDSCLHRLQTSIQAILDIGSYIIASLGLKTPETNAEIIEVLTEAGYLPKERAETYKKMIGFRNRIVHLYNHIDVEILYDILQHEIKDIKELFELMLNIIEEGA
ncbi:MAG: DUF86 domain-containing protein [Thermodesulfovibrionales bacterium]|nr:DUF86 domain-containing protein [Thermodesulfovibrionales bacterium]